MFRTELTPRPSEVKIKIGDSIYLIGSCFADHIGDLLKTYKFNTLLNPFGVIYNPYSIFKLIEDSASGNPLDENGLLKKQGIYRHLDFHSDISARSEEEFYQLANNAFNTTRNFLKNAGWLIISMGTSIVFKHQTYQKIVANCHKLPGKEFEEFMLKPEEIIASFDSFFNEIRRDNRMLKIILTVSPVRHIKSTLEKNSQSKAILRYVAGRLTNEYEHVQYFPSYEIMIDDLRDYRFYKPDMLHPNEVAIKYIWEKFIETYFDQETTDFIHRWSEIRKALGHRPFYPDSAEHKNFIRKTIKKLKSFENRVDIKEELNHLENQIT
jgi:hypothetical protein